MPKVDFRYIKTGTGDLSGPSFVEQTELAINELGVFIEDVENTAESALDTANKAQTAADHAQTTADTALSQAQAAQASADAAQQAADQAQTTANTALEAAQNAGDAADTKAPIMHASTATTYGAGSSTLYGHVQLSDATTGTQNAETGGTAATPYAVAQAMTAAQTAQQTANSAQQVGQSAQQTANVAQGAAEAAQNTADSVQDSLNQAVETFNQQIAALTQQPYFQTQDTAINAQDYAGQMTRLYLESTASSSTNLPAGTTYPCYFWTETTQDGNTSMMFVLSGNVLYSQSGVNTTPDGDTDTWTFTGWQKITYTAVSTSALGVVKPDGTTVEVAADGTLSINTDLLSTVYKFKGSVATVDNLPTGAAQGDVYNVTATDANYAWTGSAWDNIGGIEAVDSSPVQGSTNPVASGGVYTALENIQGQITAGTVQPSSTTPLAAGTAAIGMETTYARGDHVHPAQVDITGNAATATKATQDGDGNVITSTYTTQTALSALQTELEEQIADAGAQPDGTTVIKNASGQLSVPEYIGATDTTAGTAGLVPAPDAGNEGRFLRGDGAWSVVQSFAAGTRMLFNQAAAPTGWTKQTDVNDAAVRVVSGSGGGTGGSLAFSTLFVTGRAVTLSGSVGATTLSTNQIPSHRHTITASNGAGSIYVYPIGPGDRADTNIQYTGYTGGSTSHTHALSGSATIALNVKYTDVIVCAKD